MKSIRDWVFLVDKLTELTQNNQITWERTEAPRNLKSSISRVDFVYYANYNNQRLRLYEEYFKYFTDEDEYFWDSKVYLNIVDDYGHPYFDIPNTRNLNNLLSSVKYQSSNINDLFNGLLP